MHAGLIWVSILYGFKIFLQISGMVLAFLTRKVKVRGLNESLEVQLVMIITTPIVVTALLLREILNFNVARSVYALGSGICTGVALFIIFVPKVGHR